MFKNNKGDRNFDHKIMKPQVAFPVCFMIMEINTLTFKTIMVREFSLAVSCDYGASLSRLTAEEYFGTIFSKIYISTTLTTKQTFQATNPKQSNPQSSLSNKFHHSDPVHSFNVKPIKMLSDPVAEAFGLIHRHPSGENFWHGMKNHDILHFVVVVNGEIFLISCYWRVM